MKVINRSFRQLKDQIADPEKKEESLKLVGDIQKAVVAAKSMPVPAEHEAAKDAGRAAARVADRAVVVGAVVVGVAVVPTTSPAAPLPRIRTKHKGPAPRRGAKAPPKEGDQPKPAAPADPKRTEDFRRELVKLLKQTIEIEQDLLDGKFDQAKTELGKIPEMRDDAHKELGVRQGRG